MNSRNLSKAINRVLAFLLSFAMIATSSFVTPVLADVTGDEVIEAVSETGSEAASEEVVTTDDSTDETVENTAGEEEEIYIESELESGNAELNMASQTPKASTIKLSADMNVNLAKAELDKDRKNTPVAGKLSITWPTTATKEDEAPTTGLPADVTVAEAYKITFPAIKVGEDEYKQMVSYASGYTGFSETVSVQSGHYIAYVLLPETNITSVDGIEGNVVYMMNNGEWKAGLNKEYLTEFTIGGKKTHGIVVIDRIDNYFGQSAPTKKFIVDWDGSGDAYAPVIYSLDFTNVALEPDAESAATFKPMGTDDDAYEGIASSWVTTARKKGTELSGMVIDSNTYEQKSNKGDGSVYDPYVIEITPEDQQSLKYSEWTQFMNIAEGSQKDKISNGVYGKYTKGYYLALEVRPTTTGHFPAEEAKGPIVTVLNGLDGEDLEMVRAAADKSRNADGKDCFTVICKVANDVSDLKGEINFKVDWDGDGNTYRETYYKVDLGKLVLAETGGSSVAKSNGVTNLSQDEYNKANGWRGIPTLASMTVGNGNDAIVVSTPVAKKNASGKTVGYEATVTLKGELPYVKGFIEFNPNVATLQEGHYIGLEIDATDNNKTVEYSVQKPVDESPTGYTVYEETGKFSLIQRLDASKTSFNVIIEQPGKLPTTYKFDYSGVELQLNPELSGGSYLVTLENTKTKDLNVVKGSVKAGDILAAIKAGTKVAVVTGSGKNSSTKNLTAGKDFIWYDTLAEGETVKKGKLYACVYYQEESGSSEWTAWNKSGIEALTTTTGDGHKFKVCFGKAVKDGDTAIFTREEAKETDPAVTIKVLKAASKLTDISPLTANEYAAVRQFFGGTTPSIAKLTPVDKNGVSITSIAMPTTALTLIEEGDNKDCYNGGTIKITGTLDYVEFDGFSSVEKYKAGHYIGLMTYTEKSGIKMTCKGEVTSESTTKQFGQTSTYGESWVLLLDKCNKFELKVEESSQDSIPTVYTIDCSGVTLKDKNAAVTSRPSMAKIEDVGETDYTGYGDWAGVPNRTKVTLGTGEGVGYTVDAPVSKKINNKPGYEVKVTLKGSLPYVQGFTGFDNRVGLEGQQEGHYLAVAVTAPSVYKKNNADVPVKYTLTGLKDDGTATTKVEQSTDGIALMMRLDAAKAAKDKTFTVIVDQGELADDNADGYLPTKYIFDYSAVDLQASYMKYKNLTDVYNNSEYTVSWKLNGPEGESKVYEVGRKVTVGVSNTNDAIVSAKVNNGKTAPNLEFVNGYVVEPTKANGNDKYFATSAGEEKSTDSKYLAVAVFKALIPASGSSKAYYEYYKVTKAFDIVENDELDMIWSPIEIQGIVSSGGDTSALVTALKKALCGKLALKGGEKLSESTINAITFTPNNYSSAYQLRYQTVSDIVSLTNTTVLPFADGNGYKKIEGKDTPVVWKNQPYATFTFGNNNKTYAVTFDIVPEKELDKPLGVNSDDATSLVRFVVDEDGVVTPIKTAKVINGKTVSKPSGLAAKYNRISTWYIEGTSTIWDFDNDVVNGDLTLMGDVYYRGEGSVKVEEGKEVLTGYTALNIPPITYTGAVVKLPITVIEDATDRVLAAKEYTVKVYKRTVDANGYLETNPDGTPKVGTDKRGNPKTVSPKDAGVYIAKIEIKADKSVINNEFEIVKAGIWDVSGISDVTLSGVVETDSNGKTVLKKDISLAKIGTLKLGKVALKYGTDYTVKLSSATGTGAIKDENYEINAKSGAIKFKKGSEITEYTASIICNEGTDGGFEAANYDGISNVNIKIITDEAKLLSKAAIKMNSSSVVLGKGDEFVGFKMTVKRKDNGKTVSDVYTFDPYAGWSGPDNKANNIRVYYTGLGKVGKVTVSLYADDNNFRGTKTATYSIKADKNTKKVNDAKASKNIKALFKPYPSVVYNGDGWTVNDILGAKGIDKLDTAIGGTYGQDYSITYAKNKNAGTMTITFAAINGSGWTGTLKQTVKILKADISDKKSGRIKETRFGSSELVGKPGTENKGVIPYTYEIGSSSNKLKIGVEAGGYDVVYVGKTNAEKIEFTKTYLSSLLLDKTTGRNLVLGTDFKVTYSNNTKKKVIDANSPTNKINMTITGLGNYAGTVKNITVYVEAEQE